MGALIHQQCQKTYINGGNATLFAIATTFDQHWDVVFASTAVEIRDCRVFNVAFFKFIPSSYRSFIHFLIPLPFTLNCSGVKVITFWQPQHLWWQTISHRHWDSSCFCPNHLLSRSLGHHHCKKPMVGMFCCGRELGTWWPTLQNYELSKCSTTEMRNGVLPNRNLPDETRNDFNGFPSFVQIRYFDPPVTLWQKPVYFTTRYPEKTNLSLTIVYIW